MKKFKIKWRVRGNQEWIEGISTFHKRESAEKLVTWMAVMWPHNEYKVI